MAIQVKKMKAKQPLLGTNMPSSATNKKILGPVDKSPIELNRAVDKLMKGTATAGAGETPQEDASVNKQSKASGPSLAAMFTKGLRGEDMAGNVSPRDARIRQGRDYLQGKTDLKEIEDEAVGKSPTYKDWQQTGEPKAQVIVKKKVQQF
jgi:hypothetical protein